MMQNNYNNTEIINKGEDTVLQRSTSSGSILKVILYLIIASPGFFLLFNEIPYLLVISVLLGLLMGILGFFYQRTITSYHMELVVILIPFYVFLIISYLLSGQLLRDIFNIDFLRYDGNFFFCYVPFLYLAVPYFNYRTAAHFYTRIIIFTFSLFAFAGLVGFLTRNYSYLFIIDRVEGPMFTALNVAHNATGSVFAMVCILIFAFFLQEKKRSRFFYLIVLLLCLFALFITRSKGSYIGFIIGALMVLWFNYRSIKNFLKSVGLLIIALAPFVFITGAYTRIIQLFDFGYRTTQVRLNLWEKAIYLFSQSPLIGIGFGRFNDIDLRYLLPLNGYEGFIAFDKSSGVVFNSAHAHNSYFQFLSETGIIGVVFLLAFWILCFIRILRAYNTTKDEFSRKLFLSGLGCITAIIVMAFTENYLSATTVMIFLAMLISLSIGLSWQEKNT